MKETNGGNYKLFKEWKAQYDADLIEGLETAHFAAFIDSPETQEKWRQDNDVNVRATADFKGSKAIED